MLTNEFIKKHSFINNGYTFTRWDCKGRAVYGVSGSIESLSNYHIEFIEVKSDVIEVHYYTPVNCWDKVARYYRDGRDVKSACVYAFNRWLTWARRYNAARMFTTKKGARSEKAFLKNEAMKNARNEAITPYKDCNPSIIADRLSAR